MSGAAELKTVIPPIYFKEDVSIWKTKDAWRITKTKAKSREYSSPGN